MKTNCMTQNRISFLFVLTIISFFPLLTNAQLTVNGSNYVGIGITSAGAPLHVAGTTSIFGVGETGTPTATTLRGAAASGTNIAGANFTFDASNGTGTGGSGALIFRTAPVGSSGSTANSFAEIMRITSSGYVGIGTTGPAKRFEVQDASNPQMRLSYNGSTYTEFQTNSSGYLNMNPSGGKVSVGASSLSIPFQVNLGAAVFSDPGSSTRYFQVSPNGGGSGDVPAGAYLSSGINTSGEGLSLLPCGGGTNGVKLGAYIYNGSAWKSVWETANTSGLNPSLVIGKNGGSVCIATTSNGGFALNVNGGANCTTNTWTSDQKFKKNIEIIPSALLIIKKLKPSTYSWDTENSYGMNFDNKKQYGLISQDVEGILPELIYNTTKEATYDSTGKTKTEAIEYKTLNYIAFIPILMKGIQEQQSIIDSLTSIVKQHDSINNTRIENMQNQITACCNRVQGMKTDNNNNLIGTGSQTGGVINTGELGMKSTNVSAVLYQNIPNPFSQQTNIQYVVPTTTQRASIMIFDLQGKLMKTVAVTNFGNGSVTINGNELSPGMFVYSLVVDGNIIDTKRMILTE